MSATEYLSGFGNEHCSEALPGALPQGQASPQRPPYGLYTEKLSGTAFTAPRAVNLRTWLYRIRPSAVHSPFRRIDDGAIRAAPLSDIETPPDQLRWNPWTIPEAPTDFVDGLRTVAVNGDLRLQIGVSIHVYVASESMVERFFYNADGELLIVPQQGRLSLHTECGRIDLAPGEIASVPRGMKFCVVLLDGASRGYVCENHGAPLRLPERGLVGSDGFANDRDFLIPVAAYEDREDMVELTTKFGGHLFSCELDHSPLDVVAWFGTHLPYKYDLRKFNAMGSISYDHPDPSIYTVLSSQSDSTGIANVDFVIFPPRWLVAENTFRPPWFHRNIMSEFMGLIYGAYDAKASGFLPGGCSVHNCMTPHGPDVEAFALGTNAPQDPKRLEDTMAFMFESRYPFQLTRFALEASERQTDYQACWQGLAKNFTE